MTFARPAALLLTLLSLAVCSDPLQSGDYEERVTHPLVPGLRSRDLNNPDWPRPFHDRVGSGFSPLVCNISSTPRVWSSIRTPGQLRWLMSLPDPNRGPRLLVNDGRLRLVDADGQVLWTSTQVAPVLYHGPLRGGDRNYLLLGGRAALPATADSQQGATTGPQLVLMDAETGKVEWQHVFDSPHGHVKPAVGDVLPEKPGLEVAVFLSHSEDGCLIHFPPSGDPEFIWQKQVVIPGEFDEQYDHGCDIRLDLSQPDQPVIWNVRRFRCRGFNARTGEMLSTLSYEIGGAHRRNYGPWNLGVGRDGQPLICVVSRRVQTHVHGIELTRSGENKLAWQHYYGEVHKESPGVVVDHLAIADLDNDGITEVAYTVRDPEQNLRTFVRIRDAQTGQIESELPDCWGLAVLPDTGSDNTTCLLTIPDPDGRMPRQGNIRVYAFDQPNSVQLLGELPGVRPWGPATIARNSHRELLFRQTDEHDQDSLVCWDIKNNQLQETRRTTAAGLLGSALKTEITDSDGHTFYLNTNHQGQLQAWTWTGERAWQLPLAGGYTPSISAVDWDGDNQAELFAAPPGGTSLDILNVHSIRSNGTASEQPAGEYLSTTAWSPTIVRRDDGRLMVISPGTSRQGNLEIRLTTSDGTDARMELPIPAVVPSSIVINAGDFLQGRPRRHALHHAWRPGRL